MSRGMLDLEAEYYLPSVLAMRQSGNLYFYCSNNPILYYDTSGEFINIALGAVFGGIVGGISASLSGTNVWNGVISGTIGGSIAGFGLEIGTLGIVVITAASGGAVSNLINQWLGGTQFKDLDFASVATSASISGVAGIASFGLNSLVNSAFSSGVDIANSSTSTLQQKLIQSLTEAKEQPIKTILTQWLSNRYIEIPKWIAEVVFNDTNGGRK